METKSLSLFEDAIAELDKCGWKTVASRENHLKAEGVGLTNVLILSTMLLSLGILGAIINLLVAFFLYPIIKIEIYKLDDESIKIINNKTSLIVKSQNDIRFERVSDKLILIIIYFIASLPITFIYLVIFISYLNAK